jgi:hypothetical protein
MCRRKGVNVENLVLTQTINVVRTGGGIGVTGVYIPTDPRKSIVNSIAQSRME